MRELLRRSVWQLICDQCGVQSEIFRNLRDRPSAWSEFRYSVFRFNKVRAGGTELPCKETRTGIIRHHCPKCAQVIGDLIETTRRVPPGFTKFEQVVGYRCSHLGGKK